MAVPNVASPSTGSARVRALLLACAALPAVIATGAALPGGDARSRRAVATLPTTGALPVPSTTPVPTRPAALPPAVAPPSPAATTTTGAPSPPRAVPAPQPEHAPAPLEPAPAATTATTILSGASARLVGLVNGVRAAHGLAAYSVDAELTARAQAWARTMADAGSMFHTADLSVGVSAAWVRLGENVGVGSDVAVVHEAMLGSASHYENLVDGGFGSIGVGVVSVGGRLYVAEEFMQVA